MFPSSPMAKSASGLSPFWLLYQCSDYNNGRMKGFSLERGNFFCSPAVFSRVVPRRLLAGAPAPALKKCRFVTPRKFFPEGWGGGGEGDMWSWSSYLIIRCFEQFLKMKYRLRAMWIILGSTVLYASLTKSLASLSAPASSKSLKISSWSSVSNAA